MTEPEITEPASKRVKTEDAAAFDQEDYTGLWHHYMDPVVVKNAELAMGQRLRKQTRPARIENHGRGWAELRKQLKLLQRQQAHGDIYRLLRQLRDWEICPPGLGGNVPKALRGIGGGGASSSEVVEVIDISDETVIVDVDTYIIEVLLVKEVIVKQDLDSVPVKREEVV